MQQSNEAWRPHSLEAKPTAGLDDMEDDDVTIGTILRDVREAMKKEDPTVIITGAVTGEFESPQYAREAYADFGARLKERFSESDGVLVLPRREGGYTPEEIRKQCAGYKVVVVDAPTLYTDEVQKPWQEYEGLEIRARQRGPDACEWLRAWAQGNKSGPSVDEMKEKFAASFDGLREAASGMGHMHLALPNTSLTLAFLAYLYAKKNDRPLDPETVESLLERVSSDPDAVFTLRLDGSEVSLVWNDERIF